jgi:uncharacterized protein (UPF0333 family)
VSSCRFLCLILSIFRVKEHKTESRNNKYIYIYIYIAKKFNIIVKVINLIRKDVQTKVKGYWDIVVLCSVCLFSSVQFDFTVKLRTVR